MVFNIPHLNGSVKITLPTLEELAKEPLPSGPINAHFAGVNIEPYVLEIYKNAEQMLDSILQHTDAGIALASQWGPRLGVCLFLFNHKEIIHDYYYQSPAYNVRSRLKGLIMTMKKNAKRSRTAMTMTDQKTKNQSLKPKMWAFAFG